jgi:hypothetical protein
MTGNLINLVAAEGDTPRAATPRSPSCDAYHFGRSYMLKHASGNLVLHVYENMACTDRKMALPLAQVSDLEESGVARFLMDSFFPGK